MSPLETIFPADVSVRSGDPKGDWPIEDTEDIIVERAVERRKREFRAGRALARNAMSALGLKPAAILAGSDRAPIWPAGLVGSISHCEDFCVAAVASTSEGFISIGIDVEPAAVLDGALNEEILRREEVEWLGLQPDAIRGLYARLIFSAKECAYKCQYALSRRMLDFQAMNVEVDPGSRTFVARFEVNADPFRVGDALNGRFVIDADHILTGIAVKN